MEKRKKLVTIFLTILRISSCTFGGGFVIVPLLKEEFSRKRQWIAEDEIIDLMTIAQSSPGPIAVNSSVLVSYEIAGIEGAIIALFASIIPPILIITLISMCYDYLFQLEIIRYFISGIQIAVCGLIISVALDLSKNIGKNKDKSSIIYSIICLFLMLRYKVNVFYLIIISIIFFLSRITIINKLNEGND